MLISPTQLPCHPQGCPVRMCISEGLRPLPPAPQAEPLLECFWATLCAIFGPLPLLRLLLSSPFPSPWGLFGTFLVPLEGFLEILGALLGCLGAVLGRLVAVLGRLGPFLAILGVFGDPLGALLGRLGALLGPSWKPLRPPWGPLGAPWRPVGPSWGHLWRLLGPSGTSVSPKRRELGSH